MAGVYRAYAVVVSALLIAGCGQTAAPGASQSSSAPAGKPEPQSQSQSESRYFDNSGRDDVLSGGAKMIPVTTPKGMFRVWTKRVGNNPRIKVLLLHGGPAATHEYFEAFDSYFPGAGYEYY